MQEMWVQSWVGKIPGEGNPPVFLPGGSHGQRSLVGYSPWGCKVGHDLTTKKHTYLLIIRHTEYRKMLMHVELMGLEEEGVKESLSTLQLSHVLFKNKCDQCAFYFN